MSLAAPSRTDLITQEALDASWVNLNLPIEDLNKVFDRTTDGAGNTKESSVEKFDLLFGIAQSL